jgi:hypothetical protein
MATEQVPSSAPAPLAQGQVQPLQAWLARLGLSGKILAIGGLVGIVAVFLPLLSMSMQMPDFGGANPFGGKGGVKLPAVSTSRSIMVISDGRGVLCLVGYLATLALAFVLYPANGLRMRNLGWAGLGVGGFLALMALWLLAAAFNGSGALSGFGSFQVSVGIGAILNLLAAAAVIAGGFLKAREEKLF